MTVLELSEDLQSIYNELIMPVDTNIDIGEVLLSDENVSKINEFLNENKYKAKFMEYGLQPMNRLLFYGASGCGKTFLAKALTNHMHYTMLCVDIAKGLAEGNVAINVSNIFKLAESIKKCVIFFDECDSIAWSRDSGDTDRDDIRRATNSMFQHLDQMDPSNVFIAATNMLYRLDPAFERRFNLKLEFNRPKINIKQAIKQFTFKQFSIVDDIDDTKASIIERRSTLSYYEIQGIVERAMKKALMNNTTTVKTSDIYKDMSTALNVKINFKTDKDDDYTFKSSIK